MFCSTPSNTQCVSFADTHHLVDTSACTCDNTNRWITAAQFSRVFGCLQRRCSTRVLRKESEHITPLLRELHWLKVPENSVRVMCSARRHHTLLRPTLHSTADLGSRRRLRSASKWTLVIPTTRRTTLGDRAFSVTAARAWNALPSSVRSAPSLLQFRRDLKTALFQSSYSSP